MGALQGKVVTQGRGPPAHQEQQRQPRGRPYDGLQQVQGQRIHPLRVL